MVGKQLSRRAMLALVAAAASAPRSALAKAYTDLEWEDLVPEGSTQMPSALRALLPHDELNTPLASQPASSGVRTDWNGMTVRLPGYILPIEYNGTGVTAFILVPYVGACVHVPPPPANQLVFVTTKTPYETTGLFEAVTVSGMFGTVSNRMEQIDIGYALSADAIQPYD